MKYKAFLVYTLVANNILPQSYPHYPHFHFLYDSQLSTNPSIFHNFDSQKWLFSFPSECGILFTKIMSVSQGDTVSDFILRMEQEQNKTPVSNLFIDEYMPAASGEYVKVYLYLLRCMNSGTHTLSVPAIADHFHHTESDVHRALSYWEKQNLLRLEYDTDSKLTGICLLEPRPAAFEPAEPETQELQPSVPVKTDYSPDQLLRFQQEGQIRQLLFIGEQYLGKTLSPSEISTILYFYDGLKFSADMIEYLIEYCVSKGHRSMRYIESVALAWHQEGYRTVAQVKKECSSFHKNYFAVLKTFGIKGRNPVEPEIRFIDRWTKEMGFSMELVLEACSRTMAAIHQPSFEYADSILKNWHTNQIKTLPEVNALDAKRASKAGRPTTEEGNPASSAASAAVKKASASNRFHNFKQRDYDFAELEKQLIHH